MNLTTPRLLALAPFAVASLIACLPEARAQVSPASRASIRQLTPPGSLIPERISADLAPRAPAARSQVAPKPLVHVLPASDLLFERQSLRADDGRGPETGFQGRVWMRDNDNRPEGARRIGDTGINYGATREPSLQGRSSGSSQTVERATLQFRKRIAD